MTNKTFGYYHVCNFNPKNGEFIKTDLVHQVNSFYQFGFDEKLEINSSDEYTKMMANAVDTLITNAKRFDSRNSIYILLEINSIKDANMSHVSIRYKFLYKGFYRFEVTKQFVASFLYVLKICYYYLI